MTLVRWRRVVTAWRIALFPAQGLFMPILQEHEQTDSAPKARSRPKAFKKSIALSRLLALVAHALRPASFVTRREGELRGKLQLACFQGSDLLKVLGSSLLPSLRNIHHRQRASHRRPVKRLSVGWPTRGKIGVTWGGRIMMWRRLGRPCQPCPRLASCGAGKLDRATLFADMPTLSRDGILQ